MPVRPRNYLLLIFIYVVFSFISSPLFANSQDINEYKKYLIKKAIDLKLYDERYWHILLHYKKVRKGYVSYIDDPKFFISPSGKNSPKDELISTIDSFFDTINDGDNHPRCRFIARYEWLKEKLEIDEKKIPEIVCNEVNDVLSKINAHSSSLIFATSYPNSPASMFGHTLIRLDTKDQTPLLSYGINYSAIQEDKFPAIYTFKGIFGFYKGIYTVMPYYEKVKEYNDIERRDLWEYKLNLSSEEVRKMLLHLWELKDVYQYYYFFDENCSYNILFLLESARPSAKLTDKFFYWVIPGDTIRAVIEEGMVEKIEYRPSIYTRIKHLASFLTPEKRLESYHTSKRKINPNEILNRDYTLADKQTILELSAEISQYLFLKEKLDEKSYKNIFLNTLIARSKLEKKENILEIPKPTSPENGHKSDRFETALGLRDSEEYIEVSYRPAYHDLTNNDEGYVENSQVVFLDTSLRYYFDDNSLKLQKIDAIDIISITPMDFFDPNFSWKAKTGLERKPLADKSDMIFYFIDVSGGTAYKSKNYTFFVFGNSKIDFSDKFKENLSLGLGFSLGFISKMTEKTKTVFHMENNNFFIGDNHHNIKLSVNQSYYIDKNIQLGLKFIREKYFRNYYSDIKIYLDYFY